MGACETVEEKRRVVIKWFFPEFFKRRKQTHPSRSNSTATFCPLLYMVPMNPPCLSVLSKAAIVIRVQYPDIVSKSTLALNSLISTSRCI